MPGSEPRSRGQVSSRSAALHVPVLQQRRLHRSDESTTPRKLESSDIDSAVGRVPTLAFTASTTCSVSSAPESAFSSMVLSVPSPSSLASNSSAVPAVADSLVVGQTSSCWADGSIRPATAFICKESRPGAADSLDDTTGYHSEPGTPQLPRPPTALGSICGATCDPVTIAQFEPCTHLTVAAAAAGAARAAVAAATIGGSASSSPTPTPRCTTPYTPNIARCPAESSAWSAYIGGGLAGRTQSKMVGRANSVQRNARSPSCSKSGCVDRTRYSLGNCCSGDGGGKGCSQTSTPRPNTFASTACGSMASPAVVKSGNATPPSSNSSLRDIGRRATSSRCKAALRTSTPDVVRDSAGARRQGTALSIATCSPRSSASGRRHSRPLTKSPPRCEMSPPCDTTTFQFDVKATAAEPEGEPPKRSEPCDMFAFPGQASMAFSELVQLREEIRECKEEQGIARRRADALESENRVLRQRLGTVEQRSNEAWQRNQELEKSRDAWKQRWDEGQAKLEDSWRLADELRRRAEQAEEQVYVAKQQWERDRLRLVEAEHTLRELGRRPGSQQRQASGVHEAVGGCVEAHSAPRHGDAECGFVQGCQPANDGSVELPNCARWASDGEARPRYSGEKTPIDRRCTRSSDSLPSTPPLSLTLPTSNPKPRRCAESPRLSTQSSLSLPANNAISRRCAESPRLSTQSSLSLPANNPISRRPSPQRALVCSSSFVVPGDEERGTSTCRSV
eukprot:TRINITY_DN5712_c0_g1_i1.p1 TRINITY_DN5712_c0_g1~~TRINITY_DN5712_c0_g1_i1.p1  ORF type:complete len:736 (-),score=89.21 TRINITY_DN5712_c0_g1_i1:208-2415(-)